MAKLEMVVVGIATTQKRVKKNFWAFFMRQTAAAKAEQDQGEVWGGREREEEEEGEP